MMWPDVIQALVAKLSADSLLTTYMGTTDNSSFIYRSRTRVSIQIPCVVWTIISSTTNENYAPVVIQWDLFAKGAEQAAKIELRLFELMHADVPVQIGPLKMWSQLENGLDVHSEDQSVVHRALEYRYTPARQNG
jgi:hypothetical protein